MSAGTTNCPLGHCVLHYNSTTLGLTRGGSELEITVHVSERRQDEYGPVPTKIYFAGATAKLYTCLAEHTVQLLNRVLPGSSLVAGSVLYLGGTVGSELTGYPLTITPIDSSDPIGEVILQKAIPLPTGRISYNPNQERLIPMVFHGMVDLNLDNGRRLAEWSASADVTPPSITQITPANNATGVSRNTTVDIKFGELAGPVAEENFILLNQSNDTVVSCALSTHTVSASEFHVTLTPGSALAASSVHRVIVAGIADRSGNTMSVQTRKFTTGS